MSASQRRKGHAWERDVVHMLRQIWSTARRGLGQTRGAEVCDVEGTPYWIECKVGAQPNVRAAMAQALEDATKAGDPRPLLVITKRDREEPLVTMSLVNFVTLARHQIREVKVLPFGFVAEGTKP
jgi:hypothetical protein